MQVHTENQFKSAVELRGMDLRANQTLIASILHKYIANRLVDEQSILKTIDLLRVVKV